MKRYFSLGLMFVLVLAAAGIWGIASYYHNLPEHLSQHETLILGQNRFVPGEASAVRVVVRDSKDGKPLPQAEINVSLRTTGGQLTQLYTGQTDPDGNANVAFTMPADADPQSTLVVETRSELGQDVTEKEVTVARDYRVLLTTDKPLYQPGHILHMRILALSTFDRLPASAQPVELVVADAKGNKVFRQALTTSEFGVASADFQLASEVNTGNYKITAAINGVASEKTVTVDHYVLPKFDVSISSERSYYLPGEHMAGTVSAQYFYGKPVAGGLVHIEGYTFDVQRDTAVTLVGATGENGIFAFELDLPQYLAGTELDGGSARFYLEATVTDLAGHSEVSNLSLPVAQKPILIEAVPESGQLRWGVENILYVLTTYPDGTPAPATITVSMRDTRQVVAETTAYGLAQVAITPTSYIEEFAITADDAKGNHSRRTFPARDLLYVQTETILLRPDHPVYQVGETMNLTILAGGSTGTVYLDIVRDGQTLSTRAVDIENGRRADVAIDVTPDLCGTLEMHAYRFTAEGSMSRDTRLVVVSDANDLNVSLTPGKDTYLPGEMAALDIQVSGQDSAGVRSAIGLAIVDESVFALAEQDAGFARLYFMLEQELLQPRYDIHGFSVPDLAAWDTPVSDPELLASYEGAAFASLAAAIPQEGLFSLHADSHQAALQRAHERQQHFFEGFTNFLQAAAWLITVISVMLALVILDERKQIAATLSAMFGGLILLVGVSFMIPLLGAILWGCVLLGMALGLLILVVMALNEGDRRAGYFLCLLLAYAGVVGSFIIGAEWSSVAPYVSMLITLALMLLSTAAVEIGALFGPKKPKSPAAVISSMLLILMLTGCSQATPAAMLETLDRAFVAAEPTLAPEMAGEQAGSQEQPRLRQYFPETLLWLPDAVTGDNGSLHLDFPVADSITTWRMTALASSQDGRLGSTTVGLRVFQDFFVDADLPLALTVGDELEVPVGVFNYLEQPQAIRLELAQTGWFELLDQPVKQIEIGGNDIQVVYFHIRAVQFGQRQPFTVTAWGSQMSDAVQRTVQVYPNGKQINFTQSDRLSPGNSLVQTIQIPSSAISGTQALTLKIYPGVMSQVVEGLDSILRMPNGCFEQTSSSTYPNVLVLDYLKASDQASPEVQMKAEQYINVGYQRLTTFEVPSGGFSLFGNPPADRMLTAYGLQEFSDMSRVHPVDPDLIDRTAEWLLGQQESDGSWLPDRGMYHESSTWTSLRNSNMPTTAYIVWSLIEAGKGEDTRTQAGIAYLLEHQAEAEDPYVLALMGNALAAEDAHAGTHYAGPVLERLASLALADRDAFYWQSGVATFMGSQGATGSIETTAVATLALLKGQTAPEIANGALVYLVRQKDSYGTWYSTQSTIWSLKTLIESVRAAGSSETNASVTVSLNDGESRTLLVTPENFDVVQLVAFPELPAGENTLTITTEGQGALMYQVTGSYYLPWAVVGGEPEQGEAITIGLSYDRTNLAVDDTVLVNVSVTLNPENSMAQSVLIDLGLPPGFSVEREDLDLLVAAARERPEGATGAAIERYELTGRQILVYVTNLKNGSPLTFSYRLRAKFPVQVQTPATSAYDYYNPELAGGVAPELLVVSP